MSSPNLAHLPSIRHFVETAERGHHPAASSGERAAANFAKAIFEQGDDLMRLDRTCLDGALLLVQAARGPFDTDADKELPYGLICRAAGHNS